MTRITGLACAALLLLCGTTASLSEEAKSASMSEAAVAADTAGNPVVVMQTSKGEIRLELFADKSPKTVANFLRYVDEKFYDGTVFHRVIRGFMVQGGGFDGELKKKETHEPIRNEAANGLSNLTGTIAMARTPNPHSATAQFFINTVDNQRLDYKGPGKEGYAVFGKVTEGMDVVRAIESAPKVRRAPPHTDSPRDTIFIESIRRQ